MNRFQITLALQSLTISLLTLAIWWGVMSPLTTLDTGALLLDGAVCGILLALLVIMLRHVLLHNPYARLPLSLRVINHAALALIWLLIWLGGSALVLYMLLPEASLMLLLPTLPLRMVLALLLYACMALYYAPALAIEPDTEPESLPAPVAPIGLGSDEPAQDILDHIAVKNGSKIDLIFIPDIVYIQAEGDYVIIHTPKGRFIKEQTMKYLAEHLPWGKFVRIHRSSIINIDYIERIELYDKQNQLLKLQYNLQAKMSIAGYKELKRVLNL